MSADLAIISTPTTAERSLAAQARHLHPCALPRWRALLEFHWQTRLERITGLSLAYHEAQEAAADASSRPDDRLAARQLASRLAHRTVAERLSIAETEAALSRLATGRFGWCEQCGSPITTSRLFEMPATRYCAVCDR